MYRKDLYSNSSKSSRNDSGSWIYINGELYHAGVKGMHWYHHLPGTDWWKLGKLSYNNYQRNNPDNKSKVKAGAHAIGVTARAMGKAYKKYIKGEASYYGNKAKTAASNVYGKAKTAAGNAYGRVKTVARNAYTSAKNGTSKLYNAAKGYSQERISELKEKARTAYQSSKTSVHGILDKYYGKASYTRNNPSSLVTGKSGANELLKYLEPQGQKAFTAYSNATASGPLGGMINGFLQTGKYNVMAAVTKALDSVGLDDEVDRLLQKMNAKTKK